MTAPVDKQKPQFRKAFRPTSALAKDVKFKGAMMEVHLTDGRIISVPIIWFPQLQQATSEEREKYEIGGGGLSLHWPEIDEDLAVANLMSGADWKST